MPRAKRVLAEADPNASNASRSTGAKSTKRKAATQDTESTIHEDGIITKRTRKGGSADKNPKSKKKDGSQIGRSEVGRSKKSQYATKDNSKLQLLLSDRGLPTDGGRDDWIERLENSSIDYESFTTDELSDMLRQRHVKGAGQYSKKIKIERLKLNDDYDRDTGDTGLIAPWVEIEILEEILKEEIEKGDEATDTYSSMSMKKLCALLEKRGLSTSGTQNALVSRLRKNDQTQRRKRIEDKTKRLEKLKPEVEKRLGHPVNAKEMSKAHNRYQALDDEIVSRVQQRKEPPVPVCDFDWKDSHWAERTERQLTEICQRREMPGCGPKAAMIKFLETGVVDYEDLYATGLESICYKRGIKYKTNTKKVDLIKLLKEADRAEEEKTASS